MRKIFVALGLATLFAVGPIAGHADDGLRQIARPFPGNVSFSAGTSVASNSTVYFNAATPQSSFGATPWFVASAGNVTKIHAELVSAPGAGNSYTYTLYKNGASTGLTGSISGAASYSVDITGAVAVAVSDRIEVQVVSSASATATISRLYVVETP